MFSKLLSYKFIVPAILAATYFSAVDVAAQNNAVQIEQESFYDSVLEQAQQKSGYLYIYSRNSKLLLGKIDPSTPLKLVNRDGKWQYVRLQNRRVGAWVSSEFVAVDGKNVRVKASNLNLRLRPSLDAQILTSLPRGYQSPLIDRRNDFVKILAPTSLELAIQSKQLKMLNTASSKPPRKRSTDRPLAVEESKENDTPKQGLANFVNNGDTIDAPKRDLDTEFVSPASSRFSESEIRSTEVEEREQTSLGSSADYLLAPGDSISFLVYGEEDLSLENARVNGSGSVSLPLIGNIQVAGKTLVQVEREVTQALSQGYVRNPRVSVSIFSYRPVFIRGAITNVGAHPYAEGLTLANAIALAGGAKNSAKKNGVSVQRDGKVAFDKLAIDDEILILPGDVVSIQEEIGVAEDDIYYIYLHGQVRAPGEYQFRRGLTVEKAIVLAGGFTDHASKRKINLTRYSSIDGADEVMEPVKLKRVKLFTPVEPGDVIDVGASWL